MLNEITNIANAAINVGEGALNFIDNIVIDPVQDLGLTGLDFVVNDLDDGLFDLGDGLVNGIEDFKIEDLGGLEDFADALGDLGL